MNLKLATKILVEPVSTTIAILSVAIGVMLPSHLAAQTVDFGTLLNETVDRDRFAIHPDGAFTQEQSSSHDPRNPGFTSLGNPAGFGNISWSNFIRHEQISGRTEWVMLEDTGAGALSRMWVGGFPQNGTLRFYVDGGSTPVLTGQADQVVGKNAATFGGSLSFDSNAGASSGFNLYAPLPYSSSFKITWEGPNAHATGTDPLSQDPIPNPGAGGFWYNVNHRKYQAGTTVTPYTSSDPTTYAATLTSVNNALANPAVTGHVDNNHVDTDILATGGVLTHALNGTGAIRRLQVKVDAPDLGEALRNTYVELTFDGTRTTRVPVGHFFGNGEGATGDNVYEFQDFHRKVAADATMTAYWTMPYETDAEVKIVNRGAQNVDVDLEVDSGNWTWNSDSMHFHTNYRKETDIQTRNTDQGYNTNGDAHFPMVTIRGKGVFVGDTLSVRNRRTGGSGNGWWGEGDEKIYFDYLDPNGNAHNAFPQHRGTGTEDYYGYAFGVGTAFDAPFVAQPIGAANGDQSGQNETVNSRVRGLDTIPFDESFKFDMEVWKWSAGSVDFAATTHWYGRPGAYALNPVADLAVDFKAAQTGETSSQANVIDTAGDGQWLYLSSDNQNPSALGATTSPLTWGSVGDAGNDGYGGGENGFNLSAISDQFIFTDGGDNEGIGGEPGYHELALQPGGNGLNGNASEPYVVARWVAGDNSSGSINIAGSVRNFVNGGDSIDFHIYVDGQLEFSALAPGATLDETPFDFDSVISSGQTVDFVLGNNGSGNLAGDEALLRAIISGDFEAFLPDLLGDLDENGTINAIDWLAYKTGWRADLSGLSQEAAYKMGDMDFDGDNDIDDFVLFKAAYESFHGSGSFAAIQIPEPSCFLLLVGSAAYGSYITALRRESRQ